MFILDPHPRDKGACLPNFITPHFEDPAGSLKLLFSARLPAEVLIDVKLKKCPKLL
jgi:hypothetical protein